MIPCPLVDAIQALRDIRIAYLNSPLAKFKPWETPEGHSPQRDFVLAAGTHRIRIARWGNRCGKSEIGTVDTILAALGWHPTFPHKPPLKIWVSCLDWNMAGQVLWPKFRRWLPESEIKGGWGGVSYLRKTPPIPLQIKLRNGSTIDFKSADSGRRKYQGAQCHLIWLDEEHPPDVVEEVEARLIDCGGHLTVTATPIMRARWLQDLERRKTSFVNRANMLDVARAGIIDLDATLEYAETLPERQRRVRIYGDLIALEGAVYPNFSTDTHTATPRDGRLYLGDHDLCEWPPPAGWPRYAAMDFGYSHPAACVRAVHDILAGRIYVERCWYSSQIRHARWAELLGPELKRLEMPLFCDRDADGRAEFEAAGVPTAPAPKSIAPGLELVENLLEPGRDGIPALILVEDGGKHPKLGRCDTKKLAWELDHYHYPADKEGKPLKADKPVKRDDDCADALRYLCAGIVQYLRRKSDRRGSDWFGKRLHVRW